MACNHLGIETLQEYMLSSYATSYIGKTVAVAHVATNGDMTRTEGVVETILENPYMQFFIGLHEFTLKALFASTSMVYFRKRSGGDVMKEINEISFYPFYRFWRWCLVLEFSAC